MGPEQTLGNLVGSGPQAARQGAGTKPANVEQARQTAEEFEALFLSQMLAPIFEQLGTDPLFGGGAGEQVYRSMMVQEYGKAIARSGGVGIADAVQREILRLQESQP